MFGNRNILRIAMRRSQRLELQKYTHRSSNTLILEMVFYINILWGDGADTSATFYLLVVSSLIVVVSYGSC